MTRSRRELLVSRRRFLGAGVVGSLGLGLFGTVAIPRVAGAATSGADSFGPLEPPDANGLELPPGFHSRVLAVTGETVPGTSYVWHSSPDGGATFATGDGGWVYVSNSEVGGGGGGVGVIRFDSVGAIEGAYPILTGTTRNCAGGPTPWGTWLSCEETSAGLTYECDPFTPDSDGVARPALGVFKHEAAAVDPVHGHVYLTEDRTDGLIYRFTPTSWPYLDAGLLEAAEILGEGDIAPGETRSLAWHTVPDPGASSTPTRDQVGDATPFDGGEGCWYESGFVYFSTKGDHRVWKLDTTTQTLSILYDKATSSDPQLQNVDNVYASPVGDVYVAEDPDNLEIVALTAGGAVKPVVRISGQTFTEVTGPALSPDGQRLYFSSQRNPGITYEVTGPFAPMPTSVPALTPIPQALLAAGLAAGARSRRRRR